MGVFNGMQLLPNRLLYNGDGMAKDKKKQPKEKPISLAGPDFKELMKAFLEVKPTEANIMNNTPCQNEYKEFRKVEQVVSDEYPEIDLDIHSVDDIWKQVEKLNIRQQLAERYVQAYTALDNCQKAQRDED
jgi:hypothetical protein